MKNFMRKDHDKNRKKRIARLALMFFVFSGIASLCFAEDDGKEGTDDNENHRSEIAILDSANTRLWFALSYTDCTVPGSLTLGAQEYARYYLGWTKILNDAGIAFDLIYDSDISEQGLKGLKVLILSNAVALTKDEMEAIEKWVHQGGHLLATYGSGYEDIVFDKNQVQIRPADGGNGELSEIWGDPFTKLFSSAAIDPLYPGVDIRITQSSGPTAYLNGKVPTTLSYGGLGNILVSRVDPSVLGFLAFNPRVNWTTPQPGIVSQRYGNGWVVYYAFAPEFIVGLEFDLAGHCKGDPNYSAYNLWVGRSAALRSLMKATIIYLLNGTGPGPSDHDESDGPGRDPVVPAHSYMKKER